MNEEDQYNRANAFAYCAECKGPIFHGEPIIWYSNIEGEINYMHRFTTWCDHYKEQEQAFINSLAIEIEDPKL